MAPDMQARRDAFLMLTDEKPPEQPKRWLVVWTDHTPTETWTEWAQYDFGMDAEHARKQIARRGIDAQIHDLDAQA